MCALGPKSLLSIFFLCFTWCALPSFFLPFGSILYWVFRVLCLNQLSMCFAVVRNIAYESALPQYSKGEGPLIQQRETNIFFTFPVSLPPGVLCIAGKAPPRMFFLQLKRDECYNVDKQWSICLWITTVLSCPNQNVWVHFFSLCVVFFLWRDTDFLACHGCAYIVAIVEPLGALITKRSKAKKISKQNADRAILGKD